MERRSLTVPSQPPGSPHRYQTTHDPHGLRAVEQLLPLARCDGRGRVEDHGHGDEAHCAVAAEEVGGEEEAGAAGVLAVETRQMVGGR